LNGKQATLDPPLLKILKWLAESNLGIHRPGSLYKNKDRFKKNEPT